MSVAIERAILDEISGKIIDCASAEVRMVPVDARIEPVDIYPFAR